jgi:DNA polymerase III delta' subunit
MKPMDVMLTDQTKTQIEAITRVGSGSYIFHGPRSVGKATAAAQLARRLNCQGDDGALCAPCRQFIAGTYPDLIRIQPEDKPSITIEQVRGLVQALALSPYYATGIRLVLVDGAHSMTAEAQNALLKIIEEPPPRTTFILITEYPDVLLPTVRSRCGHVHFPRWPADAIARLLVQTRGLPSAEAATLAAAADGAPGRAVELAAHPETATAQLELARQAAAVPALPPFERLLLAGRLATSGADLQRFGGYLQASLIAALRNGAIDAAAGRSGLAALELYRRQLQAKVAPRAGSWCSSHGHWRAPRQPPACPLGRLRRPSVRRAQMAGRRKSLPKRPQTRPQKSYRLQPSRNYILHSKKSTRCYRMFSNRYAHPAIRHNLPEPRFSLLREPQLH